jgi:hypothetical protein
MWRRKTTTYHLHARYIEGREAIDLPGYRGEIWLNKSTFEILRLVRDTTETGAKFPITYPQNIVDYANVPLGGRTSFALPTREDIISCSKDEGEECAHNIVRFGNDRQVPGQDPNPVRGRKPLNPVRVCARQRNHRHGEPRIAAAGGMHSWDVPGQSAVPFTPGFSPPTANSLRILRLH